MLTMYLAGFNRAAQLLEESDDQARSAEDHLYWLCQKQGLGKSFDFSDGLVDGLVSAYGY
jgi:hypothetical protein